MTKNIKKCEISQKIVQIFVTCLHFFKVCMWCIYDGLNKSPNLVATSLKSDSRLGRNIWLFTDTILMFTHTVYNKIVLGIHIESKVANTERSVYYERDRSKRN